MHSFSELDSKVICRDIKRGISSSPIQWWQRLVLQATYPVWYKILSSVLYQLYEQRVIDSSRLHIISALFDKTQPDSCIWK